MKPKHQRLLFVTISVLFLCAAVLLTLRAFKENLVYFYSPSDLTHASIDPTRLIRIGGLVKPGSILKETPDSMRFRITDNKETINVTYQGMVPGLFRAGQGVVAEGYLRENGQFDAKRILTKHDEKYMPKEVVDALKKSGRWQEEKNESAP